MVQTKRKKPNNIRTTPTLRTNTPKHTHRHSRTKLETNKTHNKKNQHPPQKTTKRHPQKTTKNNRKPNKRLNNNSLPKQPRNHTRTNPKHSIRRRIQLRPKRPRTIRRNTIHTKHNKRKIHLHKHTLAHKQRLPQNIHRRNLQRLRKNPRNMERSPRTKRTPKKTHPTKNKTPTRRRPMAMEKRNGSRMG